MTTYAVSNLIFLLAHLTQNSKIMRHFMNLRILHKPNSENESINMRVWAAAQVADRLPVNSLYAIVRKVSY